MTSSPTHALLRRPHIATSVVALAAALVLQAALPLEAQVRVRTLDRPDAVAEEGFTAVTGFRELRDGRVLVTDSREKRFVALDLRTGAMAPVGREGGGPREWGAATRLHAMPGDSTLMEDFVNGRFLIIAPDGTPGPTFRIPEGSPVGSGTLAGVDARGHLILTRDRFDATNPMAGPTGLADVLRFDRATGRVDTLAQLAVPKGEFSGVRAIGGGMLQGFTNLPLAARDLVAVSALAPAGRVAVVRAAPYAVEWIAMDGARVRGARAESPGIRVTAAEKEAFLRSQRRPGQIMVRGAGGGGPGGGAGGGAAGGSAAATGGSIPTSRGRIEDIEMTWPDVKPPFLAGAAMVAPDDRVWILRTRAHDDPVPTYDVFDAAGRVVERVRLPAGTRLAGFGRGVVYLVRPDADDLQVLERHRLR